VNLQGFTFTLLNTQKINLKHLIVFEIRLLHKDFLQKYWFPHAVKLLKTHDAELRKNGYGPIMPANLNNIPVRIKSDVVVVVAILFSGSLPYKFQKCMRFPVLKPIILFRI